MPMNDFSGGSKKDSTPQMPMFVVNMAQSKAAPTAGQPTDDIPPQLINYNDEYKDADPILFRDAVIAETMAALISQRKPNAVLVGPAGTGKTAIVEDIARRIANNDPSVPISLKSATIYELPLSSIVSGSDLVGQLEKKLEAIVEFISNPDNNAIVFIDEIHQLMSRAEGGTYAKIAQILKPALARSGFRTIGATTTQEARSLMRDPAFSRRFTRVLVDELTRDQTTQVLETIWPRMYAHYNSQVAVNESRMSEIVAIADELFSASNKRPDNAITLLDRSCADAVIRRMKAAAQMPDDAGRQQILAMRDVPLRIEDIRQVAMKQTTGHAIPDRLDENALNNELSRIVGQDKPLEQVMRALRRRDLGLFDEHRPTSFLFAGPSGTGKSETARIISRVLFDEEPITLNMCEYDNHEKINKILGSAQGYVGSDWNNELPFDTLDSNPYRLILLDEIEKAHRSVQRLFMSVLEDGVLTTSLGKTIDFSHTIIIATTNASHSTGSSNHIGFNADASTSLADEVSDLKEWFDAELMNRFSGIITFNKLSRDTYRAILDADWIREVTRIKSSRPDIELPDELSDSMLDELVSDSYVADFGARPAHRAVTDLIEQIVSGEYEIVEVAPALDTDD